MAIGPLCLFQVLVPNLAQGCTPALWDLAPAGLQWTDDFSASAFLQSAAQFVGPWFRLVRWVVEFSRRWARCCRIWYKGEFGTNMRVAAVSAGPCETLPIFWVSSSEASVGSISFCRPVARHLSCPLRANIDTSSDRLTSGSADLPDGVEHCVRFRPSGLRPISA